MIKIRIAIVRGTESPCLLASVALPPNQTQALKDQAAK
jgi:hypothetical protein